MSTASEPAYDPQRLLADTRELSRRVRRAQRGTWLALLVLGATVLLAIPFYEYGHSVVGRCQTSAGGPIISCSRYPTLALWYWPVALVVAYAVIGAIFVRQARSRGVGARVRPYVIGGIVLVAAAMLMTVWGIQHPLSWSAFGTAIAPPGSVVQAWLHRLVSPLGVIGLGLLVLARVERSRVVVAFSIVYLVAVAASAPIGAHAGRFFLPGVLVPGLVLLAGSALFAFLERPTKAEAS
jgi:hypothetical protein